MTNPVVNGAFLECNMASSQPPNVPIPGVFPATAQALPPSAVPNPISITNNGITCDNQPVATINDNKVGMNIKPFQLSCKSSSNPLNAAASAQATAAASGAPMTMVTPCQPVFVSPWSPGCRNCKVKGIPMLDMNSTLICIKGGTIKVKTQVSAKKIDVK